MLLIKSNKEITSNPGKYPPKNTILNNTHIISILVYSAKKKNTKTTAECSVINPLTNSDSASAKSKGALFVSATAPIKNIINIGNNGNTNHVDLCNSIISVKLRLPVIIIIINKAELSTSS
jgi:hypothetical protein